MRNLRLQLSDYAPWRYFVLLAMTGVVCLVFIVWFLSSYDIQRMSVQKFWIPTCFLFFVTAVCAVLMPKTPLAVLPAAIFGIAVGVAWDALTDTQRDRNLFPIEVLIWMGFSMPGALVGTLVGSIFYLLKQYIYSCYQYTLQGKDLK